MKNLKTLAILMVVAVMAFGCKEKDPVIEDAITLSPTSLTFDAVGETKDLAIKANGKWTVAPVAETWIALDIEEGTGDATVKVTTTVNDGEERTVKLKFTRGTKTAEVVITQSVKNLTLSVTPLELDFEFAGGDKTIEITSNTDWTITDNPEWITLDAAKGNGDKTIKVTAAENKTIEALTAKITITAGTIKKEVTITQGTRALSVTPSEIEYAIAGGEKTIEITSDADWTITNNSAWLTLDATTGNGNKSVKATATANIGEARTAKITIKAGEIEKEVVVTQLSSLDISKIAPFGNDIETQEITVTSSTAEGWTVTSAEKWAKVTVAPTAGDGKFSIETQPNFGAAERTAAITVTRGTISIVTTLTQAGNCEDILLLMLDKVFVKGVESYGLDEKDGEGNFIYKLSRARAAKVQRIAINGGTPENNINNPEGLKYFTGLTELMMAGHPFTEIDLSMLTELQTLNLSANKLTTINIRTNKKLKMFIAMAMDETLTKIYVWKGFENDCKSFLNLMPIYDSALYEEPV